MDLKQIANEMQQKSMAARDWVFQVIRTAIVRGVLPGGMPLRQDEISAALSVSHIPVREAFRQLEAQGLVRIYPNRGAVVTKLTLKEMEDIMDVRSLLEVGALRGAFPKITPEIIAKAREIYEEMNNNITDPNKLEELNLQFHFALYRPLDNEMLFRLVDQLHANVDRYARIYYIEAEHNAESQIQHAALLKACEEGDVNKACDILYNHISNTKALLEPRMEL